jgi:hypothetical protein
VCLGKGSHFISVELSALRTGTEEEGGDYDNSQHFVVFSVRFFIFGAERFTVLKSAVTKTSYKTELMHFPGNGKNFNLI